MTYPNTIPSPSTGRDVFNVAQRDRIADLRQCPKLLDNDPWHQFKYLGNGNYAIAINGHCYRVYTTSEPGRFVEKDDDKISLWFTDNATPDEIKNALWVDAYQIRQWDRREADCEGAL